jgi:hypothetical protein
MKYVITESQLNKTIDNFITYQFEPHIEKTSKKYSDSIFWIKDREIIVNLQKSGYFWVKVDIWEAISLTFSLDYDETQEVIRQWLKEHYNLGSLRPELRLYRKY